MLIFVLTWGMCRMMNVDVALRISMASIDISEACRSPVLRCFLPKTNGTAAVHTKNSSNIFLYSAERQKKPCKRRQLSRPIKIELELLLDSYL